MKKLLSAFVVALLCVSLASAGDMVTLRKYSAVSCVKENTNLPGTSIKFDSTGISALVSDSDGRYIPIVHQGVVVGYSKETSKGGVFGELKIDEAYMTQAGVDYLAEVGTDVILTPVVIACYAEALYEEAQIWINAPPMCNANKGSGIIFWSAMTDPESGSVFFRIRSDRGALGPAPQTSALITKMGTGSGVRTVEGDIYTFSAGRIYYWILDRDENDTLSSFTKTDSSNYSLVNTGGAL